MLGVGRKWKNGLRVWVFFWRQWKFLPKKFSVTGQGWYQTQVQLLTAAKANTQDTSIIFDLQYYTNFCCTAKWLRYMDLSWATAMKVLSRNHWTTSEIPGLLFIRYQGYEESINRLRQACLSKNQGGRQKSETAPENPAPWLHSCVYTPAIERGSSDMTDVSLVIGQRWWDCHS